MTAETQQGDVELTRRLTDAQGIVDKVVRRTQLRSRFRPEDIDNLLRKRNPKRPALKNRIHYSFLDRLA